MVAVKSWGFHNYRNKLSTGKPILRFGAALFPFIFVVFKFFGKAICLVSGIATNTTMAFPTSFTVF